VGARHLIQRDLFLTVKVSERMAVEVGSAAGKNELLVLGVDSKANVS
jgi:hypothetical protein